MTALEQIIRDEIAAHGPMRFDRYMELALYHPAYGYYAKSPRIGRAGDFFTSVSVGPLFGQLLARQATQMALLLDSPKPFWIIEQGAHDGQLAIDILESLRVHAPDFSKTVRYLIIEPSLRAQEIQESRIAASDLSAKVSWIERFEHWREKKPTGLFLSNELVDAFPVRLICRHSDVWKERRVRIGEKNVLSWEDSPIREADLQRVIDALDLPAVEGYTTEIGLAARTWMGDAATFLDRGYLLTIDYGFPASAYYASFRVGGTLTTYRRHRRGDEVLLCPGENDITAHADFTALSWAGEAAGLATLGLVDQQRFLMGVAHDELSGVATYDDGIPKQLSAWNTLTHPEHLGARFQVLVQAKDAPGALDGLRYARPGGLD